MTTFLPQIHTHSAHQPVHTQRYTHIIEFFVSLLLCGILWKFNLYPAKMWKLAKIDSVSSILCARTRVFVSVCCVVSFFLMSFDNILFKLALRALIFTSPFGCILNFCERRICPFPTFWFLFFSVVSFGCTAFLFNLSKQLLEKDANHANKALRERENSNKYIEWTKIVFYSSTVYI